MVVELAKAVQRVFGGPVNLVGNAPERQRHQRKRQQRSQRQAPVNAQRHHGHHHDQGQRAIKARQHGLTRGHLHRVDVVGGQRHQVAGALLLKEMRPLQAESRIQACTQLGAQPVARSKQLQPPGHAQKVNGDSSQQQPAQLHAQNLARHDSGHQAVHHVAHLARNKHRECTYGCQHQARKQVRAPVLANVKANQAGQSHGGNALQERVCLKRIRRLILVMPPKQVGVRGRAGILRP